jgi:hypothetical protein
MRNLARRRAVSWRAAVLLAAALVGGAAAAASAQSLVPQLPDPTDCHQVNALLHLDNVRDCDGSRAAEAAPPPLPEPVTVQRRSDGAVCVTVSEQLPQCVGPVS